MSKLIVGRALTNAKAGEIVTVDLDPRTEKQKLKCNECGKKMKHKEEINFGECDKCCAWKYRDLSR